MQKIEENEIEELFLVCRTRKVGEDYWNPAIKDLNEYEVTPVWTAALMYNILARHLDCVDDADQLTFEKQVKETLEVLYKDGMAYTERFRN